jgi:acetyltransferase-like isoleucine patch superfamily enzyme
MSNFVINCSNRIEIGNKVMVGGGVTIWDSNFHSTKFEKRMSNHDDDVKTRPTVIEDGVFIGANSIIKSVHIGKYSVIGAGSVVMHDIPSGEVWAGNPARFIKKIY